MTAEFPEEYTENINGDDQSEEFPPFEFEIELVARSSDPGGMAVSFANQLAELGGNATLISQTPPQRVDSSNGKFWFEARRVYKISL